MAYTPGRRVVGRSFGWLARFQRLARAYGCQADTVAGLHFVALAILMVVHLVQMAVQSS